MAGTGDASAVGAAFPHLLSPIAVGPVTLRNRVIMGSMHTGLEDRARDLDRLTAFLVERARGGVGLIVTGGCSPTLEGRLTPGGADLRTRRAADRHRPLTEAVHAQGARIVLQLLHAGRYAYHPFAVGASSLRSPIGPFRPHAMSTREVDRTASAYARAAGLARRAGYDGVELMGSEGYLLHQFLAPRTNTRTDRWGGSARARMRFPLAVARRVRAALGDEALLQYRISLLDLVEGGQTWEETVDLAHALRDEGVDLLTTGIGWHEARVPTIVTSVPRAAFADLTARLRAEVGIPVAAANRIPSPGLAEQLLASGVADLVTMARPLLADAALVRKAATGREREIIPCIACNQACLDHTFSRQPVSCLLNPRSGHETSLVLAKTRRVRTVAVVGGGPAGLAAAVELAGRGHRVTLFEAGDAVGGQFLLAARIPGKEEYTAALDHWRRMLDVRDVDVRLGTRPGPEHLTGFDEVVVATGVSPRVPAIPGIDHPSVLTYAQVVGEGAPVGRRVAILGSGGIGFDVAEYLVHEAHEPLDAWRARWGVGDPAEHRGGLTRRRPPAPLRTVTMLQRKASRPGAGLGRTTGWVHRATLRDLGVTMLAGVEYVGIGDEGLAITVPRDPARPSAGREPRVLAVDSIVVCTGQEPVRDLVDPLRSRGARVHVIGGADVAAELDAKRAIRQATELAARL